VLRVFSPTLERWGDSRTVFRVGGGAEAGAALALAPAFPGTGFAAS
jgi:hypothetical protein